MTEYDSEYELDVGVTEAEIAALEISHRSQSPQPLGTLSLRRPKCVLSPCHPVRTLPPVPRLPTGGITAPHPRPLCPHPHPRNGGHYSTPGIWTPHYLRLPCRSGRVRGGPCGLAGRLGLPLCLPMSFRFNPGTLPRWPSPPPLV
jgi:hypothetical protein